MAQENSREKLEQLRGSLDIVLEIQTAGVPLRRSGDEWVGPCPFHQERTPSFYVNPQKRVWLCRGCQAGGDIFAFFELKLGLDFPDVVRMLQGGVSAPRYLSETDPVAIIDQRENLKSAFERPS